MKAYRAAILRFDSAREPRDLGIFEEDDLLVVRPDAQGTQLVQWWGRSAICGANSRMW